MESCSIDGEFEFEVSEGDWGLVAALKPVVVASGI